MMNNFLTPMVIFSMTCPLRFPKVKDTGALRKVSSAFTNREMEMITPRKSRSSFAIVPSEKAVNESVRSLAAVANTSVFSCPEISDLDKLLARCSQENIVPFTELLPEETLLACKKVRVLFFC